MKAHLKTIGILLCIISIITGLVLLTQYNPRVAVYLVLGAGLAGIIYALYDMIYQNFKDDI